MNIPTLGEARFPYKLSHTISDDVRIPERIEIGADSGLQFELAGPRAKLFFDPRQTRAGIDLSGMLAGSMTNPPALAFATNIGCSDAPNVAYATVYPLTTLLRILSAQVLAIVLFR